MFSWCISNNPDYPTPFPLFPAYIFAKTSVDMIFVPYVAYQKEENYVIFFPAIVPPTLVFSRGEFLFLDVRTGKLIRAIYTDNVS